MTLWDCFPIEKFTKELDGKGTTRVLVQSEKGAEIMNAVMKDLKCVAVDADKLTEGVNEMYYSVLMNPRRDLFLKDFNELEAKDFFKKWFPITWKVRMNAFIRLGAHRLGVYTIAKRLLLLV